MRDHSHEQRRERDGDERRGDHQKQHPSEGMKSIRRERQASNDGPEAHVGIREGGERDSHRRNQHYQHGSQRQQGSQHQQRPQDQQGAQHRQQGSRHQHGSQQHQHESQRSQHGSQQHQNGPRQQRGFQRRHGSRQHQGQDRSGQQSPGPDEDRYHQNPHEGRSRERTSAGMSGHGNAPNGQGGTRHRGEHGRGHGGGHDVTQTGHAEQYSATPDTRDERGHVSERAHGGRRNVGSRGGTANPQSGGQRGERSNQGPAGHVGGQYGQRHGSRSSEAESAGFHDDERYAGGKMSSQDYQFGSRRGHGSRRQPTFTSENRDER